MIRTQRARGIVAASALIATAALALVGCSSTAAGGESDGGDAVEMPTVRFGYIADFNGASLLAIAEDFRAENLDETVQLTADMLKGDAEAFASDAKNAKYLTSDELTALTEDGTVATWLTSLNEYFVSAGKLDKATDASTYYLGDAFVAAGK